MIGHIVREPHFTCATCPNQFPLTRHQCTVPAHRSMQCLFYCHAGTPSSPAGRLFGQNRYSQASHVMRPLLLECALEPRSHLLSSTQSILGHRNSIAIPFFRSYYAHHDTVTSAGAPLCTPLDRVWPFHQLFVRLSPDPTRRHTRPKALSDL